MKSLVCLMVVLAVACQFQGGDCIPGFHLPSLNPLTWQKDVVQDTIVEPSLFIKFQRYVLTHVLGIPLHPTLTLVDPQKVPNVNGVAESDVEFLLYTRGPNGPQGPNYITKENFSGIKVNKPVKIIIHGWHESSKREWYHNLTREFLIKGDYNVIQVDWNRPANNAYIVSSIYTQYVGEHVANLIAALVDQGAVSLLDVHVIGHSLGGQVASATGRWYQKVKNTKLYRITGLDAAGPLFEFPAGFLPCLAATDADIVDAIHTDAGVFGCKEPIGTIDFYPNGGHAYEPGCPKLINPFGVASDVLTDEFFCSHHRSYDYYIASVNDAQFVGTQCPNYLAYRTNLCAIGKTVVMGDGYPETEKPTGVYYLKTLGTYPFLEHNNIF